MDPRLMMMLMTVISLTLTACLFHNLFEAEIVSFSTKYFHFSVSAYLLQAMVIESRRL